MGGGVSDEESVAQEEQHQLNKLALEISRSQKHLESRASELDTRRNEIRSYKPGKWIMETGDFNSSMFEVPVVTTLLMVGPMGAGKSTLINNLIRVINNLRSGFDRAQVCGDPSENGTLFLKEYMLCDKLKNICVFDTRGFSELDLAEDLKLLKNWMTNGVRHGEIARRSTEEKNEALELRTRYNHHHFSSTRKVNFVIFVVNALSVQKMRMEGSSSTLVRLYKSPFLSFKDDRPVVVMTHGDELSAEDRLAARIHLGQILGVSAGNQIFDIPGYTGRYMDDKEQSNAAGDMAVLEMLEFALTRADRNLAYKPSLEMLCKEASRVGIHSSTDLTRVCLQAMISGFQSMDLLRRTAMVMLIISWISALTLFLKLIS